MATQPQQTNLNVTLNGKISANNDSITDITNESLPNIQSNIDNFTPSCTGFDTRIVALASSITTIQAQIAT